MDDIHKIKDCLRELAGGAPIETEVAKVLSTDGATCAVIRVRDGMVISPVRLNAISTSDKGVVVVPKTGTYVLVSRMGENGWFVSQCGEAERITIDVETEIVINGGGNHGLVNIEELKNNLDTLKNYIETMKMAVSEGLTSIGAGPSANGATGKTAFETAMASQSIHFNDMEDTKVTH